MEERQNKHLKKDIVKEIAWTFLLFVVYAVYCFVMVLTFSFIFHAYIKLSLRLLIAIALIGTVLLTVLHILKVIKEFRGL